MANLDLTDEQLRRLDDVGRKAIAAQSSMPGEQPIHGLISVPQVAEYLSTTERHVRELIYRRELPYFKVGRLVRIDVADLHRWLESKRVEAAPR